MKFKILKEAYSPEVIDSYLKDVYNAYDRLKDCLYALSHAVEGDKKLESTVDSVIYDLEDDFYDYMKFHLDDVENSIHPKEEEDEEEDYEESLKESHAETKLINEAAKPNLNNILAKSKKDIIDAMPSILKAAGYACEQVTNDSFDIYDAPSGCKAQDIIKDIKYICDLAGVKYEIDNNSLVFNDGSTLVDVYPNVTFTVDCKWIE